MLLREYSDIYRNSFSPVCAEIKGEFVLFHELWYRFRQATRAFKMQLRSSMQTWKYSLIL